MARARARPYGQSTAVRLTSDEAAKRRVRRRALARCRACHTARENRLNAVEQLFGDQRFEVTALGADAVLAHVHPAGVDLLVAQQHSDRLRGERFPAPVREAPRRLPGRVRDEFVRLLSTNLTKSSPCLCRLDSAPGHSAHRIVVASVGPADSVWPGFGSPRRESLIIRAPIMTPVTKPGPCPSRMRDMTVAPHIPRTASQTYCLAMRARCHTSYAICAPINPNAAVDDPPPSRSHA